MRVAAPRSNQLRAEALEACCYSGGGVASGVTRTRDNVYLALLSRVRDIVLSGETPVFRGWHW